MGRNANEANSSPTKFKLNNKFTHAARILIKFTVFTFIYSLTVAFDGTKH